MKLHIEVDCNTTPVQFSALAGLFQVLAGNVIGCTDKVTAVPVPLTAGHVGDGANAAQQETTTPAPEVEVAKEEVKVTRRRRTKAEIEADEKLATENSKVADAEALAQQNNEAAITAGTETNSVVTADTGETVNTVTGEITGGEQDTTPPADTAETVDADPNEKAFTEGEVQALATLIARSKGPDVVRNKIAELGGTRISALTAAQINKLGAFLESQK